jgi:hypothetical protein
LTPEKNPYAAPEAHLDDLPADVPEKILKQIKSGWIAALISAGFTLVVTLLAVMGTEVLGFTLWSLFDVGLILGLAFGIYKKSRTCAVLMLVYFIASKIMIFSQTSQISGIVVALIFAYYYWNAIVGTFAYHQHIKEMRPSI